MEKEKTSGKGQKMTSFPDAFQLAVEKRVSGEYREALNAYHALFRDYFSELTSSDLQRLHAEIALIQYFLGEYSLAKKSASEGLKGGKENDQIFEILGRIAVQEFQFPEARSYFEKMHPENPGRSLGYCLIAVKTRQTKLVFHHLQALSGRISPDDPEYRTLMAYGLLLSGDTASALQSIRRLEMEIQHHPFLELLIAEVYMTAGHYGEAVEIAKRVQKHCPENDQVLGIFAHAAYGQGDYAKAKSYALHSVKRNPLNHYASTILMKCSLREGDTKRAQQIGVQILALSPEYSLAHANLGDLYFATEDYENAKICYGKTHELMDSKTKGALLRKARMNFMDGKILDAIFLLEGLTEGLHSYYDDAMCDLLLCYDHLKDQEKKERLLQKMSLRKAFHHRTEEMLANIKASDTMQHSS